LHCSTLEQHIWLKRGSRRLEFHTWMSWAEKHKLLKVRFPFAVSSSEAMHEIQFGYLKRPTHRSRRIDQDRFEVCQQKWSALAEEGRGVAVLNDCKYGISAEESTLSLSLLRAPVAPDAHADIGEHSFAYALYAWNGSFVESRVQQEALEFNVPVQMVAGGGADVDDVGLDSPYQARSHEQGRAVSLFSCDAPTIILETVKLAEDGSGDVVLRLYESSRTATRCKLLTGFQTTKACETDMLENGINTLPLDDGVRLDFRPFEIKTVRLCWQP
jgi:alpha-mannosidase